MLRFLIICLGFSLYVLIIWSVYPGYIQIVKQDSFAPLIYCTWRRVEVLGLIDVAWSHVTLLLGMIRALLFLYVEHEPSIRVALKVNEPGGH